MARLDNDGRKRSLRVQRAPISADVAPAPPAWSEKAPGHVTRELLGWFLQDRDTRIVHDVYAAKPECLVDAIRNGTFFHFWSEIVADASEADDPAVPLLHGASDRVGSVESALSTDRHG